RRHTRFDCDWSSDVCSSDLGPWRDRAARVRAEGLEPLTELFLSRWFTAGYAGPGVDAVRDMLKRVDAEGYAACCDALARLDVREIGRAACRERVWEWGVGVA